MAVHFTYECIDCGKRYAGNSIIYLCPSCSAMQESSTPPHGTLKVNFDYDGIRKKGIGFENLKAGNWMEILPVKYSRSFPNLKIGNTPLYHVRNPDENQLPFDLYFKDDSQNPTFSFKDRASAQVSAFARENGINTIVTASTGNAGSSIAGICANQKQQAIVLVPASAPLAKLIQIGMYGADLILVKGTYDDAYELSVKATEEFGWYNRNTGFNPLTIEGKKTASLELFDQMGQQLPDRIFVPVGDGVIVSGIYKGFEDLLKLELISRIPTIVLVQSAGSDNLVRNLDTAEFTAKKSQTFADSISVDYPRNFYMTRNFFSAYHGESVSVNDEDILAASRTLSSSYGLFAEPAAAAAFAGLLEYQKANKLLPGTKNVVMLTGSGLKDIAAVSESYNMPEPINPDVSELNKRLI